MATFSIQLQNDERLMKTLRELPKRLANKVLRQAMKKAAAPALAKAKEIMARRQDTGQIYENLKVVLDPKRTRTRFGYILDSSGARDENNVPYEGFVEFGHRVGRRPEGVESISKAISRKRNQLRNTFRGSSSDYFRRTKAHDKWAISTSEKGRNAPVELLRMKLRWRRVPLDRARKKVRKFLHQELKSLRAARAEIDNRKKIKPAPYMRPAFDATVDEAKRIVLTEVRAGIAREVAALRAKGG